MNLQVDSTIPSAGFSLKNFRYIARRAASSDDAFIATYNFLNKVWEDLGARLRPGQQRHVYKKDLVKLIDSYVEKGEVSKEARDAILLIVKGMRYEV